MKIVGIALFTALSVASLSAAEYFGLSFDPSQTNSPTISRLVPANAWGMQLTQPDGKRMFLAYDRDREGVIKGVPPWVGFCREEKTEVWADPDMTGGSRRTAYSFKDGILTRLYLDGTTYEFPHGVKFSDSLSDLFPEVRAREWGKNTRADIWQGQDRLRLWFTNPNCAGFLFATAFLLALAVLISARWYWKLLAIPVLGSSFYALALTGARAAMLALLISSVIYVVFAVRRLFSWKSLLVLVGVALLAFCALKQSGMTDRFTTYMFHMDDMIQLRFDVGRASLQMLADGPCGWKMGVNPGRTACLNWYLPSRERVIRTHLLTLGECGWFLGFGYLLFWSLGLALGAHAAFRRRQPLSLAIWLAFALAAMFNPVHTEWMLWVVPGLVLGWQVWQMMRDRQLRAGLVCLAVSVSLSLVVVVGLIVIGRCLGDDHGPSIRSEGGIVKVNGEEPVTWIVGDFAALGGWGFPGREITYFYRCNPKAPSIAYAEDVNELPRQVKNLVLVGRSAETYLKAFKSGDERTCRAERVIFLSPSIEPWSVPEELLKRSTVRFLCGSFAAARWKGEGRLPKWAIVLPGLELYVPNWMDIITGSTP